MEDLFTLLFVISVIVQAFFLVFIFGKIISYQHAPDLPAIPTPVSIVVCARNELNNLQQLIPALLQQNFSEFEIILVNDRSEDGSKEYLASLSVLHSNIQTLTIDQEYEGISPKKYALSQGIHLAKNKIILLTDADCRPLSKEWISSMTAQIGKDKEVCLGYSPYEKKPGLLNLLIRFETFYTAIQYFSLALAGKPYMGVGRNMAYTKNLFLRHNGFDSHQHIWSGDDDLFGNETFKKQNITISLARNSQVISKPKLTYKEWFFQKTRHLSAGLHYRMDVKIILGVLFLSHLLFYVAGMAVAAIHPWATVLIFGLLFRTLLIIYTFVRISKILSENIGWYWMPLLDFIYVIYYILFGLNSIFSKHNRWM